ncbi:MAG: hypothetical protein IPJ75_18755 [Ignavibacteriales bacterium]|nr:hypothetical protein [Ignavibacteriales bacterium]
MGIDLSKGVVANYDLSVDLNFPQTIGFGIAYKASPKLNSLLILNGLTGKKLLTR